MADKNYKNYFLELISEMDLGNSMKFLLKWLAIALCVGFLSGSTSAFFLTSLDWVSGWRESHRWIIWLLPVGGLLSGVLYHYFGKEAEKGNALIFEEVNHPSVPVPFKMAPLVLIGTLLTHLFGGSAGREGTAVQMGGAIADRFTSIFRLNPSDRRLLLIMGISAGFASVFGTPLAGAVFALEVALVAKFRYEAAIPSFLAAIIADYACKFWKVSHTEYSIPLVPHLNPQLFLWAILSGLIFGLCSVLFIRSTELFKGLFKRKIAYPPLRLVAGGVVVSLLVFAAGSTKYIGLGILVIADSFYLELPAYDFLLKLLFTAITLGAGFKGGEVTPLFFIGAALGNALAFFVPLPLALLAGMGFVAVFSGATNTPIASTILGIELFGAECGVFVAIACLVAYLFSGKSSVYGAYSAASSETNENL